MPAAIGPPCVACGKKQAISTVPRCPFCRRVLCWRCLCPGWWGAQGHPAVREREIDPPLRKNPDCALCREIREKHHGFGPSHDGSRNCQSGSLASGGQRAHCTCDVCF